MITSVEHSGFKLKDVNYNDRYVLLEANDGTEQVKFSFEYIQDLSRYTNGEWDWRKLHPSKE